MGPNPALAVFWGVKKKAATRRDVTITDEQGQLAGPLL